MGFFDVEHEPYNQRPKSGARIPNHVWEERLNPKPRSGVLTNTPKVAATVSHGTTERVTLTVEVRYASVRLRAEAGTSRIMRQYQVIGSEAVSLDPEKLKRLEKGRGATIKECSARSRLRLQSYAAELDAMGIKSDVMVTLTYPGRWQQVAPNGRAVKRHLDVYRKRLKRYLASVGVLWWSALWFMEFQQRGAPHLHLILFGGVYDVDILAFRRWSKHAWGEIVSHPDPRERAKHLRRGCDVDKMKKRHFGYAAKYASKMKQKAVPVGFQDVGRFWGIWSFAFPKPEAFQIEVNYKQLSKLALWLYMSIKDKSREYAKGLLGRFEPRTLGEFRHMSASAVVFGSKSVLAVKNFCINHPDLSHVAWPVALE